MIFKAIQISKTFFEYFRNIFLSVRLEGVAGCRLRWQLVLSRLQLQYSPWYPPDELRNGLLVQKSKKTNYKLILL